MKKGARRFFRLVEIPEPPTLDELEKAGETVISTPIQTWQGRDSWRDHGLDHGIDEPAVEIYGDKWVLYYLLNTQIWGELRFRAPYFWHFLKQADFIKEHGASLTDETPRDFERWFPERMVDRRENCELKNRIAFLENALKNAVTPQQKGALVSA